MKSDIRVRFAPSPTGHLHIGSLRSALFNWLFARHHKGTFLLRIEDTDLERSKQEYLDSILRAFSWLGITADEPLMIQSQRVDEYQTLANQLVNSGRAYRCYCTTEEVAARVSTHVINGESFMHYDGKCRSLSGKHLDKPYAIRFMLPDTFQECVFEDLIRGSITIARNQLDDFVIIRSDGMPMYNFAVVVDDNAMRISHIIRGEEHIVNTPKQILLYEACNFKKPQFAHIPLILGPSGEKLSKRDGAVSVMEYKQVGYLADALICYLARLGWSHGDQEIFTREQLIEFFSLDAVGKKGSIFDITKLKWVNAHFIKQLSAEQILQLIQNDLEIHLEKECAAWKKTQLQQAILLCKDRVSTLQEIVSFIRSLYQGADKQQLTEFVKSIDATKTSLLLNLCIAELHDLKTAEKQKLADLFSGITKKQAVPFMAIGKPVRFALLGTAEGPSIVDIILILGLQESIRRITQLQDMIGK